MLEQNFRRPDDVRSTESCDAANYRFEIASPAQLERYLELVRETYGPLGFMNDHADGFMPRSSTQCHVLTYCGEVVGSCSLTPVKDERSLFHNLVPGGDLQSGAQMIELNNIILVPELRGGIGLALILYHAAIRALETGADLVVGITRYQTLRHFVEAGAIPVDHEPLHMLGREDLHDFVIYYDIRTRDARTYLRERARRLFAQARTLHNIRSRVNNVSSPKARAAARRETALQQSA
jgi:hypothetical protein